MMCWSEKMDRKEERAYLEYQRCVNSTEKTEDILEAIYKSKSSLIECRGILSASWGGENATSFIGKMTAMLGELEKIGSEMKRTADMLNERGKEIRKDD